MDRLIAGIKTPTAVTADVKNRLLRTWAETVLYEQGWQGPDPNQGHQAGTVRNQVEDPPQGGAFPWPHSFPLGQPNAEELASAFGDVVHLVSIWREQAKKENLSLAWRQRRVHGTEQQLPTHLVVNDIDSAARIAGWRTPLATARTRARILVEQHPDMRAAPNALRKILDYSDADFELLSRAAQWFAARATAGNLEPLTPRQVPIEGLHAKWLNTRQALVQNLAGLDDLGLLPPHPPRLHFTYLDPDHLAAGGRRHDCATVGDRTSLPYLPRIVIISENKDTAIHFPPLTAGVVVEGNGRGGSTAASFTWITSSDTVFYWGDIDADGFEILNEFRAAGVTAQSLLMDHLAYERWERYGTNIDRHGKPLQARTPRETPHLTPAERALYENLCSPTWTRHRRIEQERIPLYVAVDAVSVP